jgi:hypothetical protein
MKALALSVLAVALAHAAPAHAGAGSLKAHLDCTADGTALKAKQKAALDKDVTCAVVVDGGAAPADATVIVDAKVTTPIGAVKGHPHEAKATDGKHFAADAFKSGQDYLACGGLRLDATIVESAKVLWTGSLAVSSSCPVPKAATAKANCGADSANAGYVTFPGNGDKLAAELSQDLTCTVVGPDDASAHFGVLQIEGSSELAFIGVLAAPEAGKPRIAYKQFIGSVVPKCKPFVVDAAVLDTMGAPLWQGKVSIAQSCKKH